MGYFESIRIRIDRKICMEMSFGRFSEDEDTLSDAKSRKNGNGTNPEDGDK